MKDTTKRLIDFLKKSMVEDGVDNESVLDADAVPDKDNLRSGVRDAIVDLMHICQKEGIEFLDVLNSAGEVFDEETSNG